MLVSVCVCLRERGRGEPVCLFLCVCEREGGGRGLSEPGVLGGGGACVFVSGGCVCERERACVFVSLSVCVCERERTG